MKRVSLWLMVLVALLSGCASAEKSLRKGNAALQLGEYADAADYYRRAYVQTPGKDRETRGRLARKMGDCYRHVGFSARAVGAFQNAIRYKNTDSLAYRYLGDAQRLMGDYRGAIKSYEEQLRQTPEDSASMLGIAACNEAPKLKEEGSPYTVHEAKMFNSSRSDYSPAYGGDKQEFLYFSSTRSQASGDELSGITGMKAGDIFFSKKDEKGNWKQPEAVQGGLNTDFDEGACCLSPDGKTMYLTVCRTDPQYPRMAEIWSSTRADANWGKPQQVKISSDTLSCYAHPAISPDGRYLYFVSDMPGGFGGLDLWRVETGAHGMGGVENLGPSVNTAGNEMFPTFRPSGELYFSSDGRGGMGGLDLYRAREDTLKHTWTVVHLPSPVNSNGDDFSMTFEGLHNRGYFSSNRSTGGRGWDKLFEFSHPEILQSVKGWVYEQDGYELPAAQVYMVGDDGTNLKLSVKSDGSFEQEVHPDVDYLFLGVCKGYLNVRNELRVAPTNQTQETVLQFPLPSITSPVLVRNVFYEFNKADIAQNSQESLDRLAKLLKENPNVTIELAAHCDYRGLDVYNDFLSQKRAESVVKYLIAHGVQSDRLTPKGYGKRQPKTVTKKVAETYPFLHVGDTLTEAYIKKLTPEQQEDCNALNRRTEFRVLRTTYGLFDDKGRLKTDVLKPKESSGS